MKSITCFYSWPAEGRPRPKVPNFGGVYRLQVNSQGADKSEEAYRCEGGASKFPKSRQK